MSTHSHFVLTLLLLTSSASADDPEVTLVPRTFQTADGLTIDAQYGRLWVPENRNSGSDEEILLSFVLFPCTGETKGPPIIYLAGGPGGSGINAAMGSRIVLFQALREFGDVIALDQRGTGDSSRLPAALPPEFLPLDEPATRETMHDFGMDYVRRCVEHWQELEVDLSAYNTEESADDLNDLRRALGADRMTLWGISYGTHLAFCAMRRHPERIHRAILAGVEGPDHTVKLPSNDQALLETIAGMVAADEEASEFCPDLLGMLGEVLERVEEEEIFIDVEDPRTGETVPTRVTAFDIQRQVAATLRGPSRFSQLPMAIRTLHDGNFEPLKERMDGMRWTRMDAMAAAMDVASGITEARRERVEFETGTTLLGGAINFPYFAVHEALGVPDLGDDFRAPLETDIPTLFISGTLDGRTPVSNAEEVRQGFSDSIHLVIDGAGHSDPLFLSDPGILETMRAFLAEEELEDRVIQLPPMEFDLP